MRARKDLSPTNRMRVHSAPRRPFHSSLLSGRSFRPRFQKKWGGLERAAAHRRVQLFGRVRPSPETAAGGMRKSALVPARWK